MLKCAVGCFVFLSKPVGRPSMRHNGLALGEEADFEALNFLPD
jgi:hypothetical protein